MSLDPSTVFIVVVGSATLIVLSLALFYFNKIAGLLRGGKGWGLFRVAVGMYMLALIIYAVSPTTVGELISNSCSIIGAIAFIYAFVQIRSGITEVMK